MNDQPSPPPEQPAANRSTRYWLLATIVLILIIGIIIFVQWRRAVTQPTPPPRELPVVTPDLEALEEVSDYIGARPIPPVSPNSTVGDIDINDEHIRGNPANRIAILEYSSLSLPYARLIHPALQELMVTNQDDTFWIFRHFPMPERALDYPMAKLSECVDEQSGNDIFWAFIDTMFSMPPQNEEDALSIAESLVIDPDLLRECYGRTYTEKLVQDDKRLALFDSQIRLVPSFIFVDTATGQERMVPGIVPADFLQAVLDEMLKVKP